ncbi:hypothetical protein Ciccas_004352 [Cichlidogyrus casuarinus]|uniref:Uncharacterized protein n=1 Tax=Cichlidogyrus casuarinus TaxID=1844966 RepID=A0ABD2QBR5_9PLAT
MLALFRELFATEVDHSLINFKETIEFDQIALKKRINRTVTLKGKLVAIKDFLSKTSLPATYAQLKSLIVLLQNELSPTLLNSLDEKLRNWSPLPNEDFIDKFHKQTTFHDLAELTRVAQKLVKQSFQMALNKLNEHEDFAELKLQYSSIIFEVCKSEICGSGLRNASPESEASLQIEETLGLFLNAVLTEDGHLRKIEDAELESTRREIFHRLRKGVLMPKILRGYLWRAAAELDRKYKMIYDKTLEDMPSEKLDSLFFETLKNEA